MGPHICARVCLVSVSCRICLLFQILSVLFSNKRPVEMTKDTIMLTVVWCAAQATCICPHQPQIRCVVFRCSYSNGLQLFVFLTWWASQWCIVAAVGLI